ncbi:MAG: hypothetical protein ACXWNJ_18550 [Vulcanimicrobiaceae bacterium]
MTTSSKRPPAVTAAFTALVDYAGLFPPSQLAMAPAVEEYTNAHTDRFAWMLGRFIVPASRIAELLAELARAPAANPPPLSVIVDADSNPRTWLAGVQSVLADLKHVREKEPRISIEALEMPLPALHTQRETYDAFIGQAAMLLQNAGLRDLPAYIEMPRGPRRRELLPGAMFALARHGLRAKIRCGGLAADAVPAPDEIAAFLRAVADERVAFKATAGLHHPVRHLNQAAGFTMHGFLNVLSGALVAQAGAGVDDIAAVIAQDDPHAFGFDLEGMRCAGRRFTGDEIARMRRESFIAYGSCSFSEPTEDLVALGMLEG